MREFEGDDLKILKRLVERSESAIEERYTSEPIVCPTCKKTKPRRRFINARKREFTICNDCRSRDYSWWSQSTGMAENKQGNRSDTTGSVYIKMLEDNIV